MNAPQYPGWSPCRTQSGTAWASRCRTAAAAVPTRSAATRSGTGLAYVFFGHPELTVTGLERLGG